MCIVKVFDFKEIMAELDALRMVAAQNVVMDY